MDPYTRIIKFVCPTCNQDMTRSNSTIQIKNNKVVVECMTCGNIAEEFLTVMED